MKQTSNLYVNSISSDSKSCPKKIPSYRSKETVDVIIVVALQENTFESPTVS